MLWELIQAIKSNTTSNKNYNINNNIESYRVLNIEQAV